MENRWMNALVKTIITIIVLHVVFLTLGFYWGDMIGWFRLPMIWAHWHDALNITAGIIGAIALYLLIFFLWPGKSRRAYES